MLTGQSSNLVAIDTETNGRDIRGPDGFAVGVSVAKRDGQGRLLSFYLPFRHLGTVNYDISRFRDVLQRLLDSHRVIFHNANFDLTSLSTLGLDTSNVTFLDTVNLTHLVDENLLSYELDYLAKTLLNDPGKQRSDAFLKLRKMGWHLIPATLMAPYAAHDADMTYRLYEYLKPYLNAEKLGPTWNRKARMVRQLMEMERQGIRVDTAFCTEMAERGEQVLKDVANDLGVEKASGKELEDLLLNRLALPVVKETPTGRPCFDKEAMAIYEDMLSFRDDKTSQLVLEYRGWEKAVSAGYRPYVEKLSGDGRLRCSYILHGTVTGRLSCRQPNLQQIPRHSAKPWNGSLKQAFIPDPGHTLIGIDYSQLELRLNTHYSRIQDLKDAFDADRDVFSEMATALDRERQVVKTLSYALAYGSGAERIAKLLGLGLEGAEVILNDYFSRYPGFRSTPKFYNREAKRAGRIQLWSGRYRHFDRPELTHKAYNSLIQGGAADVVEDRMLALADAHLPCRMLLQIHDELVFEIRDDLVSTVVPEIQQIMIDLPQFDVRFKTEAKVWGAK